MHESLSQTTYNELIKSKAGLVSTRAARAPWTLSGMNLSCYKTLCVFLFPPNRLSSLPLHTVFFYELLSLPTSHLSSPAFLLSLFTLVPPFQPFVPTLPLNIPSSPNHRAASHIPPPPPFRKTHFQDSFRQRSLADSARPVPPAWSDMATPRDPPGSFLTGSSAPDHQQRQWRDDLPRQSGGLEKCGCMPLTTCSYFWCLTGIHRITESH